MNRSGRPGRDSLPLVEEGSAVFVRTPLRRRPLRRPWLRCWPGFTLIEILIVVVILSILATIVAPRLAGLVTDADDAVARANAQAVKRAVVMYYQQNGQYPPAIVPALFVNNKVPVMPDGYAINYNPVTGEVTLITP